MACDSYHKWQEDVSILKDLGVDFYRFSLSWTRILPSGFSNDINQAGITYYNNLINALLDNNIEPCITLYHWDLPQSLQDLGGWPNEKLVKYFEDFADVAFRNFGDRVKTWITFNEPLEICQNGYGKGEFAPRVSSSGIGDYLCSRTILLAHAAVYHLYDIKYRPNQNGKFKLF